MSSNLSSFSTYMPCVSRAWGCQPKGGCPSRTVQHLARIVAIVVGGIWDIVILPFRLLFSSCCSVQQRSNDGNADPALLGRVSDAAEGANVFRENKSPVESSNDERIADLERQINELKGQLGGLLSNDENADPAFRERVSDAAEEANIFQKNENSVAPLSSSEVPPSNSINAESNPNASAMFSLFQKVTDLEQQIQGVIRGYENEIGCLKQEVLQKIPSLRSEFHGLESRLDALQNNGTELRSLRDKIEQVESVLEKIKEFEVTLGSVETKINEFSHAASKDIEQLKISTKGQGNEFSKVYFTIGETKSGLEANLGEEIKKLRSSVQELSLSCSDIGLGPENQEGTPRSKRSPGGSLLGTLKHKAFPPKNTRQLPATYKKERDEDDLLTSSSSTLTSSSSTVHEVED